VIAFDPWLKKWEFSVFGVERVASLEELLKRSDVLSIHAPLTPETKHLVGERELRFMKPTACIVNTSRGPIIDEAALIRALSSGAIAGAGLDVYETEPLSVDNPLLKLENTILTPHLSWYTEQSEARLKTEGATALRDGLTGKRPEFLVNPEVMKP
jgi:D-3-phosphoglycerate dehydrogenase